MFIIMVFFFLLFGSFSNIFGVMRYHSFGNAYENLNSEYSSLNNKIESSKSSKRGKMVRIY